MTVTDSNGESAPPQRRPRKVRPGRKAIPPLGVTEWLRPGEYERAEQVLADLRAIRMTELRTGISWADWFAPGGEEWYQWLLPRLARQVNILPCFLYTPPSLGIAPKSSSPPREPKAYADFIDVAITRFGDLFEWIELWNEPNNLREWDVTMDPEWLIFSEMVGGAAYWAQHRGKRTALGGMSPIDPNWLRRMFECGVMQYIDAVGIHGFPDTYEYCWEGWEPNVTRIQETLDKHGSKAEIWITEVGFSTWRHNERRQLRELAKATEAPVDRVYWYALHDLDPDLPTVDGFHSDEREYHFGLKKADGTPKLLFRLWAAEGIDAVRDSSWLSQPVRSNGRKKPPTLITGGAGFIGTNLANRLLESGQSVLLLDNLSRPGVEQNVRWLRARHGDLVQIDVSDVRDPFAVRAAVERASQVFHLAGQVAVTTSLSGPIHDFEVNVRGTLNLLEAMRGLDSPPPLVFTSTNKVYGALQDVKLRSDTMRYDPEDPTTRLRGVSENRPADFYSPYGCSKGAADQYVIDYARTFGLQTSVFRMSCIYGPHQFGTEDQGWVAHFLVQALKDRPITLYGDGLQVRDVLYVDDLVEAFLLAQANMETISGQAFNIGGGSANAISLIELLDLIEELNGKRPSIEFGPWRPGDQKYYVSDTGKFEAATGWSPCIRVRQGIQKLHEWLAAPRLAESVRVASGKGVR